MVGRTIWERLRPNASRPLIMGRRGSVASEHPLATQAGMDVLRGGGNAVDAAVAVACAIGVVEPFMSGLGGDGFYHVLDGRSGRSTVYNGSGAAPMAATVERILRDGPTISAASPLSMSTPGAVGALAAMHAAHGSRPWVRLFAPAIDLARHGFAATHAYRLYARSARPRLRLHPRSAATYLADGDRPALGSFVKQPELAETLATIARDGAETFYRGPLAGRIAAGVASAGALLTADDLAAFRVDRQAPIAAHYRGFEVRQTPPNSMGFAMLQALKIVERSDVKALGWGSAELIHLLVEAKKRAFLDRERLAGDPRWAEVPVEALLSEAAIDAHAGAIDPEAAMSTAGVEVEEGDTTYFCVVDGAGNAVSAIQSLSAAFGCAVTAGDTGIVMNSRMTHWHLADGHPNRLAPGKRVRQTLTAPMVLREGQLLCAFGTPGGDNQLLTQLQVLLQMIEFGIDPQRAVEAPRFMAMSGGAPGATEVLGLERGIGQEAAAGLERRGHRVRVLSERGGAGSVSVILRRPGTGLLMAASDHRRDAWAGAW